MKKYEEVAELVNRHSDLITAEAVLEWLPGAKLCTRISQLKDCAQAGLCGVMRIRGGQWVGVPKANKMYTSAQRWFGNWWVENHKDAYTPTGKLKRAFREKLKSPDTVRKYEERAALANTSNRMK